MEYQEAIAITYQINKALGTINKIQLEEIRKNNKLEKNISIGQNIKIANKGIQILKENNYEYITLYKKIKSRYGKINRIKKRINKMNIEHVWFCTWTINDRNINKDHIRKLKELYKGLNYIINVDYGKNNERKHYHGIIESIEKPIEWKYGYCKFIKIKNKSNKLSEYITKLTLHTIKETTKQEKIIYSRVRTRKEI